MHLSRPFIAAIAATALAAPSAQAAAGDYTGKVTNRYGETRFSIRGAEFLTVTLSPRVAATSRRVTFAFSCRTANGAYKSVAAFIPLANQRRLSAPIELAIKPARCRVERRSTVIATMTARPG